MPEYVKGAFISMKVLNDSTIIMEFHLKGTTRALFSTISDRDVQGGYHYTTSCQKLFL